MKYPALIVNKAILTNNTEIMFNLCKEAEIEVVAVTKAFCAHAGIAQIMVDAGIRTLADSRIQNLKKISHLGTSTLLLRTPMMSEVDDVVDYADTSLNSEMEIIQALAASAHKKGKNHNVILMLDLGDLREGILPDHAVEFVGRALDYENIHVKGVGVNFNCFGGVIPTEKNLSEFCAIASEIEKELNFKLEIISGGNSGSIYLLKNGKMPKAINQLRVGEAILRGIETTYQQPVEGMKTDVFTFAAEIIELKDKPSMPFGEIALNAFGQKPSFKDKGIIKRAIVACGRQDVMCEQLTPMEAELELLGASSDHMVIDVSNSARSYRVGDVIEFNMGYGALISASASEYVYKTII